MTNEMPQELILHNGAYTVAHPTNGHFTVKVYTAKRGDLAGRRIVALLQGPNNETDWKGVGFWIEGDHPYVSVWRRFRSPGHDAREFPVDGYHWSKKWNRTEQKLAIWSDLALRAYAFTENGLELLPTWETGGEQKIEHRDHGLFVNDVRRGTSYWRGEGYELQLEGRCAICNRRLTNPESIRFGIGPECRSKG